MNIVYDSIADRAYLKDAAQKREPEIERVFGPDHPAEAVWELRAHAAPRELVLIVRDRDRQAEEPITSSELFDGNGPFTDKLRRMKEGLVHNGVWRLAVHQLVDKARGWLASLPSTTVEEYEVTLNEERSGKYTLPALRSRSSGAALQLEPVAGWVVPPSWFEKDPKSGGERATGRADLEGTFGPVPLYLIEPSARWVYQARVLSPESDPMFFGIVDESAFLKLAEVCMNG